MAETRIGDFPDMEEWEIVLTHTIVSGSKRIKLDDPIRVRSCNILTDGRHFGNAMYVVNEMIDKLKFYLLDEMRKGGKADG